MTEEAEARGAICRWGRSLFERGLTPGSSGNISVRLEDGSILATPTDACLGFLDPRKLAKFEADGTPVGGQIVSKEWPLHQAFYEGRSTARAVIHLHAAYSAALSCLSEVNAEDAIAPVTPYTVMRVGRVPIAPYARPGSNQLHSFIAEHASRHPAILLANHGPMVSGSSLRAAVFAIEELEHAARLMLILRGAPVRILSAAQIEELERLYPLA
jgi:ribulose-5-phosphate 4-epimerase/fuculose-1-phosphate aldolase